jgi:hypothetical protein
LAVELDVKVQRRPPLVVRYLDVVLVVIALPVAVGLGAPVLGCAMGTGGWLAQRVIGAFDQHWTRQVAEPTKRLGYTLFEGFARIWLLALVIVIAAVIGGHEDGLWASLFIFGAYTVAFLIKVLTGPRKKPTP